MKRYFLKTTFDQEWTEVEQDKYRQVVVAAGLRNEPEQFETATVQGKTTTPPAPPTPQPPHTRGR